MAPKISVQLWSLQKETKKDFVGALKKVAEMGYDGVEFAGYGGLEADELKELLDSLGLEASGSHVGIDALRDDLDGVIAYNKAISNRYIICPWADINDMESAKAFGKEFAEMSKKIKESGLVFGYHNHGHEFAEADGEYVFDICMNECSDAVYELDTYWSEYAGVDTEKYLAKIADRCPLIHMKDMQILPDGSKESAAYGEGILDNKKITAAALKVNPEWLVIEWEDFESGLHTPFDAIDISIKNLKKIIAEA